MSLPSPAVADGVLFDGTTHCDEELPLGWSPLPSSRSSPTPPPPDVLLERNGTVLRLLAQLEEHRQEAAEDKTARDPELRRLSGKLDLMLELVGALLALQRPPPPVAHVHLSCRGLVWYDAPDLAVGDAGRVLLHLHAAVPQPLELYARVIARDDGAVPRRAWLAFDGLPEALAAQLERYTFRHHRRAVAGLRLARN